MNCPAQYRRLRAQAIAHHGPEYGALMSELALHVLNLADEMQEPPQQIVRRISEIQPDAREPLMVATGELVRCISWKSRAWLDAPLNMDWLNDGLMS